MVVAVTRGKGIRPLRTHQVQEVGSRSMADNTTVKTSLNLPEDVLQVLRELAEESNTSAGEVIREAISTEAFLENAVQEGGRILLKDDKDGVRELVIPR